MSKNIIARIETRLFFWAADIFKICDFHRRVTIFRFPLLVRLVCDCGYSLPQRNESMIILAVKIEPNFLLLSKGFLGLPFYLWKRHPISIWLWHITDDSLKGEREKMCVSVCACPREREGQKKMWVFTVIPAILRCPSKRSQQGRFLLLLSFFHGTFEVNSMFKRDDHDE